jgi:hypothetical protein
MRHPADLIMRTCAAPALCACALALSILGAPAQSSISTKSAVPPKNSGSGAQSNQTAAGSRAEPEIPQSVFVMPAGPKEGKDPFFPSSSHPYQQTQAPVIAKAKETPIALTANGIVPFKLIMICGKTFSAGEEGDVRCGSERRHLRCIRVKEDSAIVEVNGDRQEVKMRQGQL